MPSPLAAHWTLDPAITFLNHGSFGACPRIVQEVQQEFRERMEREPVRFLSRELEPLVDASRRALAELVGASAEDLVFVPNATTAVNAVVRSLNVEQSSINELARPRPADLRAHRSGLFAGPSFNLKVGDELLATDHGYNACNNALQWVADRSGARVVYARVPLPLGSEDEVVEAVLSAVTPRTRFALIDHVTSPTGLVFPIARIVQALEQRGVRVMVDGAHAPGMVPLDLSKLGASYYTGNCHKWLCAPKGVGFLYVRRELQHEVRPHVISHGANAPLKDRSRFHLEFDWVGTDDPTPILALPAALSFLGSLLPGGFTELMARNRVLALEARAMLAGVLNVKVPAPESMIGSLAALELPEGLTEAFQDELLARFGIEVPIMTLPGAPRPLLRISAQLYNAMDDYQRLGEALRALLGE